MVGKDYEQGGIIKHGAMMINAVTQLHGAAHLDHDGRVVRRRELRHVRPRLRPALPLRLALGQVRRDGSRSSSPACCRSSPGRPRRRRASPTTRRPTPACGPSSSSPIEEQSPAVLPLRDGLRRRRHRPARHPHRARHLPVRDRERAGRGHRRLRRLQDVSGMGNEVVPTSSTTRVTRLLVANRAEIASRVFAHLPPPRHRDGRRALRRRRRPAVRRRGRRRRAGCPATARPTPTCAPTSWSTRPRRQPAPTRSTPATASSPRTPTSPAPSSTPGSPGSARRPRRSS